MTPWCGFRAFSIRAALRVKPRSRDALRQIGEEGEDPKGDGMPKPRAHSIAPEILQLARDFRHPLTAPEANIWHAVRNRQLGFKFRRQHAIGRFIADFYCAESKLVIEIDGDTHAAPDQKACDAARTAWLVERGFEVIRFQAGEGDRKLQGVLEAIRRACETRTAGGR